MDKALKAALTKVMQAHGRKGGQARARKLSAAQRKNIASLGGRAKAAKRRTK